MLLVIHFLKMISQFQDSVFVGGLLEPSYLDVCPRSEPTARWSVVAVVGSCDVAVSRRLRQPVSLTTSRPHRFRRSLLGRKKEIRKGENGQPKVQ